MEEIQVKTFTATELNDSPGDVFREVDRRGIAQINHANYPDRIFVITCRERNRVKTNEQ